MPVTRGPQEFRVNSPHDDEFPASVCKLVINCGALEWESLGWIDALGTDRLLYDTALHMKMAYRIELILALLDRRQLPPDLLATVQAAWDRAKHLAKIRNLVAHGPLTLGWQRGSDTTGPPDVIAIPNLHSLRQGAKRPSEILQLKELKQAVHDAGVLVEELHALRKQVVAPLDPVSAPG